MDIAQRPAFANVKINQLPLNSPYKVHCYMQDIIGAAALVDYDVDFTSCPANSTLSLYMYPRKLYSVAIETHI
jgi:hypothetical protein